MANSGEKERNSRHSFADIRELFLSYSLRAYYRATKKEIWVNCRRQSTAAIVKDECKAKQLAMRDNCLAHLR